MSQIDNTPVPPLPSRAARFVLRWAYVAAVIAAVCIGFTCVVALSQKAVAYGQYTDGRNTAQVFVSESVGGQFGLIQIVGSRSTLNIILEPQQWDALLSIWQKARQGRRIAPLHLVGEMRETDAKNARLFMLAGTTIRIVLREDAECLSFDVPRVREAAFGNSLLRVADHFAGKPTGTGVPLDTSQPLREVIDTLTHWPAPPPGTPDCGVQN